MEILGAENGKCLEKRRTGFGYSGVSRLNCMLSFLFLFLYEDYSVSI